MEIRQGEYPDEDTVEELTYCAKELGFDMMSDLHYTNVGYRDDGTPVIVDWDGRFMTKGLLTLQEIAEISGNYDSYSLWDRCKGTI